MSFTKDDFAPGEVFEFEKLEQIRDFEVEVASVVKPELDAKSWRQRADIVGIWRVPKFHGRLQDIQLTTLDDPYGHLLTVEDRGLKLDSSSGTRGIKADSPDRSFFYEETIGFSYSATASGVLVAAEVFYVPLPRMRRKEKPPVNGETPKAKTDNQFDVSYDYDSGERVWQVKVDRDSNGKTLRRPVSKILFDEAALKSASQSSSIFDPSQFRSAGTNPSAVYNF